MLQSPEKTKNGSNPFGTFRLQCEHLLHSAYSGLLAESKVKLPEIDLASTIESPSTPEFGQIASSLSFELSRIKKEKPITIAKEVAQNINRLGLSPLIESVEAVEPGYVNFHLCFPSLTQLTRR